MPIKPIFLQSITKSLIWGKEIWSCSAHANGDNVARCGSARVTSGGTSSDDGFGTTLSFLWQNRPELFNNIDPITKKIKQQNFPLLTKFIYANDDLSIQVHPDDDYAYRNENGSLGKTECWYIVDCTDDAAIVIGHNARSKKDLQEIIKTNNWKNFIRKIPIKKGDFFFIPPGTVHAIKGGTVIFETQQSSDITYRVYDYNRLNNGKPRELHIDKAMEVINFPFNEIQIPHNNKKTTNDLSELVSCKEFTVWYKKIEKSFTLVQDKDFMICSLVSGKLNMEYDFCGKKKVVSLDAEQSFILPYNFGEVVFTGSGELIISSV